MVAAEVFNNDNIIQVRLQHGAITVEAINIGCGITAIYAPDRHGISENIVAGYSDLSCYNVNKDYLGVIIGRYANRIERGSFLLDDEHYQLSINDGDNHLHGGIHGFGHKSWQLVNTKKDDEKCSVRFCYNSPDGEEGYPGALLVFAEYALDSRGRLFLNYSATSNKATPVNLTNHSYFNLTGFKNPAILEHKLMIDANLFTEKNKDDTSSGKISAVDNTALDFRHSKKIVDGIDQFPLDLGYNHNFILNKEKNNALSRAAVLSEDESGRVLTVYTDQPAMQVYTANYWDGTVTGSQGCHYERHGGIALETQAYPGSVNHPHFPTTILRPGGQYQSTTIFEFGIEY